MIVIKENKLNVGNISDNDINNELIKKNTNRFLFNETKCVEYIDKFKKFITRVYKIKEQEKLPKFNEFFLLTLLKIYIDEKDNLNEALDMYEKISNFNTITYFKKLFSKNINGKNIKYINGKYLEKTLTAIMAIIQKTSESDDDDESDGETND